MLNPIHPKHRDENKNQLYTEMKKIFTSFLFSMMMIFVCAQDSVASETEMADLMRDNGKIYVVIAVMLTILFGLILYLVRLDKKIGRLEKEKH